MALKRVYFRVHGTVQGVGFRYFTQKRATELNITGWVRNTDNGKVEGEAQGEEDAIKTFLKHIDNGPRHAHVCKLEKEEREVVPEEEGGGFEIRR
ncbi:hypothetical protein VTJ04DRAFT_2997 [Mycothermus thermophilus]|uniref:uncharacterized protein n=1 Tax=Humicola insolens TaxID=85995 RepID=UPI003742079D